MGVAKAGSCTEELGKCLALEILTNQSVHLHPCCLLLLMLSVTAPRSLKLVYVSAVIGSQERHCSIKTVIHSYVAFKLHNDEFGSHSPLQHLRMSVRSVLYKVVKSSNNSPHCLLQNTCMRSHLFNGTSSFKLLHWFNMQRSELTVGAVVTCLKKRRRRL